MRITKDGFIWKLVTYEQACRLIQSNVLEVYMLRDDDSEFLIEEISQLNSAVKYGYEVGIEVGNIKA